MKKILAVKNEAELADDFEFDYDETELISDAVAAYFKYVIALLKRHKRYRVLEMSEGLFERADRAGFIYYHDYHGPMFGNIIVEVCNETL